MHVMEWGAGRPVLLLHGNPTWGFLYRKVVAALRGEPLRLVVPDLVGLGFSDKPRQASEHRLESHAGWLGALLDGLALEGLVFVGQDWGGPIGLRALAERPGLAKGLVVLNTGVGPPRPGFRPTLFHRLARVPLVSDILFRALAFPQRILHRVQGDPASISGDVAREMLAGSPWTRWRILWGNARARKRMSLTRGTRARRWKSVGRKPGLGGPTPVFRTTSPFASPGLSARARRPMGPPQSWPTNTRPSSARPSSSAPSRRAWLSSRCSLACRGLSEKPRPTRSGTTRRSGSPRSAATTLR